MPEQTKFKYLSIILYIVFILVGLAMIGGAAALGVISCKFRQNAEKITATVSDIRETMDSEGETHYEVYITYEFLDSTYRNVPLDYHRGTVQVGSTVKIWCSLTNPRDIQSDAGAFVMCAALGGGGLIFLALGIVPGIIAKKSGLFQKP